MAPPRPTSHPALTMVTGLRGRGMTSWRKDLEAMRSNPRGWRYAQVARVLSRSGFELRGSRGTSHRTWLHPAGARVTVVDRGTRALKAVYVLKAVEAIDLAQERK